MKEAIKIITDLISRRFYGKLIITFNDGKIVLFNKDQTIKPEDV